MSSAEDLPCIIQGGMGVGVSDHRLAGAVARAGGLGVVSGTALDTVMVRRLELGDPGGEVREALDAFPFPTVAARIKNQHFVAGGVKEDRPLRLLTLPTERMKHHREAVLVVSSFVEVFLAKRGHSGKVGINLLEKIQLPTLPSLFGAMLAGVDVVLVGAGIPLGIPGVLDAFSRLDAAELKLHVEGSEGRSFSHRFDPKDFLEKCRAEEDGALTPQAEALCRSALGPPRPAFLAIISSHVLAKQLHKKASGRVDGFVVESHVAGGHNAPPRKKSDLAETASPYGEADQPDLRVLRELGLPFWLAGGRASASQLEDAREKGARGIQVGTAFAYANESGIREDIKQRVIAGCRSDALRVETDFEASPTGYPFKLVLDDDDPGERTRLRERERVCDLGYLRQAYVDENGKLGFRCAGEPVATYLKKGGTLDATKNKMCLCNGLLATVGLGQRRSTGDELPILTAGEGLKEILTFLAEGRDTYTARDVIEHLLRADVVSAAE